MWGDGQIYSYFFRGAWLSHVLDSYVRVDNIFIVLFTS